MYRKLERLVTGSLTTERRTPVVPRVGPEPPSWWIDDEEAAMSSMLAAAQLGVAQ